MLGARVGPIGKRSRQRLLKVELLVADVRAIVPRGGAPAVIDEAVVRNSVQESAELRARLVTGAARNHAAPYLLEDIVRDLGIACVAREITIQGTAMTAIK